MRQLKVFIIVLALMWASCATAQVTNNISIDAEIQSDKIELSVQNTSNETVFNLWVIVQQDDILMFSQKIDIRSQTTVTIRIPIDCVEYCLLICMITAGGNSKSTEIQIR